MTNKHYVVLPEQGFDANGMYTTPSYKVVCLAHDVSGNLKRSEADALANALNLESCHLQEGFGDEA